MYTDLKQSKVTLQRTGTQLPRPSLWRCFCWWSQRWCWRNAGEEAVGVYNRTLMESSHGIALPQEGPLWRRPEHMGYYFPWSVAKLKRKKTYQSGEENTYLFLNPQLIQDINKCVTGTPHSIWLIYLATHNTLGISVTSCVAWICMFFPDVHGIP